MKKCCTTPESLIFYCRKQMNDRCKDVIFLGRNSYSLSIWFLLHPKKNRLYWFRTDFYNWKSFENNSPLYWLVSTCEVLFGPRFSDLAALESWRLVADHSPSIPARDPPEETPDVAAIVLWEEQNMSPNFGWMSPAFPSEEIRILILSFELICA